jgi:hypothetical protein
VSGPAETAEANFRNPVGSARNKTNFCVPWQGHEITVTGNEAPSNRSSRRSVQAMPAGLNGRFLAFLTLVALISSVARETR